MDGLATQKAKLAVVTGELAEGWVYGIGSDPVKLQQMRELARAREAWVKSGAADMHPSELARFTLLSTKNSEHTWGIHNAAVTDSAMLTGWDNARPALPRSWVVFKSPSHVRTTCFCVFKPSAQTRTVAPHCGSHCHQLRVCF